MDSISTLNPAPLFPTQHLLFQVGALLAAEEDLVALIDADTVVMASPFVLTETDIFRDTGKGYTLKHECTVRDSR